MHDNDGSTQLLNSDARRWWFYTAIELRRTTMVALHSYSVTQSLQVSQQRAMFVIIYFVNVVFIAELVEARTVFNLSENVTSSYETITAHVSSSIQLPKRRVSSVGGTSTMHEFILQSIVMPSICCFGKIYILTLLLVCYPNLSFIILLSVLQPILTRELV